MSHRDVRGRQLGHDENGRDDLESLERWHEEVELDANLMLRERWESERNCEPQS